VSCSDRNRNAIEVTGLKGDANEGISRYDCEAGKGVSPFAWRDKKKK